MPVLDTPPPWFCNLHQTWNTGDCNGCDDDLIGEVPC